MKHEKEDEEAKERRSMKGRMGKNERLTRKGG
jgi:hypothetical protein